MSEEKKDICKICGKIVEYYKITKPNGKSTHRAFHEGEAPEGAIVISKHSVSSTYRNRMRQALQHGVKQSVPEQTITSEVSENNITPIEEPNTRSVEIIEESEVTSVPKLIEKEKIVPSTQGIVEYNEIHTFPEGSDDKPELDVSNTKRNKFAVIGEIARKLRESKPEKDVNEIRSSLIANGGNFPNIVAMASNYLRFTENGQPLFFEPRT